MAETSDATARIDTVRRTRTVLLSRNVWLILTIHALVVHFCVKQIIRINNYQQ